MHALPNTAISPYQCAIEFQDVAGLTMLKAVVHGHAIKGTYQFEVMSNSANGITSNTQAGAFSDAPKSDDGSLSTIAINASPNSWSAQLKVFSSDGTLVCTSSLP